MPPSETGESAVGHLRRYFPAGDLISFAASLSRGSINVIPAYQLLTHSQICILLNLLAVLQTHAELTLIFGQSQRRDSK